MTAIQIKPVGFEVGGDRVRGDLYLPAHTERKPPVVVMAHGFGGERRFRLPAFAEYFAYNGLAVLLFDYRGFGDSEGEPRGLVDPERHLEDYAAAVAFARTLPEVDGERLALWGTSFSGGHSLVTAARLPGIKAVVAQVPHLDGLASAMGYPPRLLPRATWLAARDIVANLRDKAPVRMPIIARSGPCCLAGDDCYDGYLTLIPPGADWLNAVPARILFTIMAYRPVTEADKVRAPVLLIASRTDSLIPYRVSEKTASLLHDCRFEVIDGGHFAPYTGPTFERVVKMECDFLKDKLSA
ncbi:MAG TPA: alpha/beta fold hydrolase [Moraxellaceae bacterium]|nr:alpha/beta fold hydrolase [Moraxellaceae bacterium]